MHYIGPLPETGIRGPATSEVVLLHFIHKSQKDDATQPMFLKNHFFKIPAHQ